MTIQLKKPYKIALGVTKRYQSHYNVPAERSLIIPTKLLGDEVSCDIRWKDEHGELHLLQDKVFVSENIVPLNAFLDVELHKVWLWYYGLKTKPKE